MKPGLINKKTSAVYDIRYHIIFVTKYRRKIFVSDIIPFLNELLHKIAQKELAEAMNNTRQTIKPYLDVLQEQNYTYMKKIYSKKKV